MSERKLRRIAGPLLLVGLAGAALASCANSDSDGFRKCEPSGITVLVDDAQGFDAVAGRLIDSSNIKPLSHCLKKLFEQEVGHSVNSGELQRHFRLPVPILEQDMLDDNAGEFVDITAVTAIEDN